MVDVLAREAGTTRIEITNNTHRTYQPAKRVEHQCLVPSPKPLTDYNNYNTWDLRSFFDSGTLVLFQIHNVCIHTNNLIRYG